MKKSTFKVSKMDCPSEEQMIRMKLETVSGVQSLEFDLPHRLLLVYHSGHLGKIDEVLGSLQMNSKLVKTEETEGATATQDGAMERKLLKAVLAINLGFFLIEGVTGFIANSMGLVADSLDMLADAIVYGLSLYVVGKALSAKKNIVKIIAYFQLGLAIFGLIEVLRRFFGVEETPIFQVMILLSALALLANLASLVMLQRSKGKEIHIKASQICTSTDILANLGVILAGTLVYFTKSGYPDLIIGLLIFFMVARGSRKIMQLSK